MGSEDSILYGQILEHYCDVDVRSFSNQYMIPDHGFYDDF